MIGARTRWLTPRRLAVALAGVGLSAIVVAAGQWPPPVAASGGADVQSPMPRVGAVPRGSLQPSNDPAERGTLTLTPTTVRPDQHPLDGLSVAELAKLARYSPERLGCATIGRPNRGRLLNGVALLPSERLHVIDSKTSFGTVETVQSIEQAVEEVWRRFPGSPSLAIGDLSRSRGGYLRPHRSHQSGLDADLGYYYHGEQRWYTKATSSNLDRARTWALVKALVGRGNVEYLFIDREIQALLREYAASVGEPEEFLAELFETPKRRNTLVRHVPRHRTHLHVRFVDPLAEKTARRLQPVKHLLKI